MEGEERPGGRGEERTGPGSRVTGGGAVRLDSSDLGEGPGWK